MTANYDTDDEATRIATIDPRTLLQRAEESESAGEGEPPAQPADYADDEATRMAPLATIKEAPTPPKDAGPASQRSEATPASAGQPAARPQQSESDAPAAAAAPSTDAPDEDATCLADGAALRSGIAKSVGGSARRVDAQAAPPVDTIEFVPKHHHRSTAEHTVVWKKEQPWWHATWKKVRTIPPRTLVLAGITVTALVGAAVMALPEKAPKKAKTAVAASAAAAAKPADAVLPLPPGATVSSAQAADYLLNGQLERALALYQRLHKQHPDDEAFALAVRILEREVRK